MGDWIPYDKRRKEANPLPAFGEDVWLFDGLADQIMIGWRAEWARAPGYWSWMTYKYRDDNGIITHWQPLQLPDPPPADEVEALFEGNKE